MLTSPGGGSALWDDLETVYVGADVVSIREREGGDPGGLRVAPAVAPCRYHPMA